MKLLITGATGVIGSEIIALGLKQNYEINYLTTSRDKIRNTDSCKGFYWDPGSGTIDMKCFEGVDAIINLAGASVAKRWTAAYKEKIVQSRVLSLALLNTSIARLKNHRIKSIVTASAIGIYPDSFTTHYEEDHTETSNTLLGDVVVQWEKAADALKQHDVSLAKIRIGIVLSKTGGALPPMAKAVKYFVGAPFGSGLQWQSWVHINDIARLFLFAAGKCLDGIYNGVAPNPVTHKKLIKSVASQLHRPLFLPAVPKGVLKLIFGEMAYILWSGQRVSSRKIAEEGFAFDFKTIHSALKDLL